MPLDWGSLGKPEQKQGGLDWSQLGAAPGSDAAYNAAINSDEGKKLAAELRVKADKELINRATDGKGISPNQTAFTDFTNTLTMNAGRNIAAGVRSLGTGNSFEHEYQFLKDVDAASSRLNPKSSMAGTAGGIVAQGVLMAPEAAASLGGRIVQGAGIGGGTGYVSELMDSHDPRKAAFSAVAGTVLGAGGVPVVEGAAGLVGKVAGTVGNTVSGWVAPGQEAYRRVASALSHDMNTGRMPGKSNVPLMTLDEAKAAQIRGQDAVVGDLGGANVHNMARDAANTSSDAEMALNDAVVDRSRSQNSRVAGLLDKIGWGKSSQEISDKIGSVAKTQNEANYGKFRVATSGGIWNDDLARLVSSPAGQAAIEKTVQTSGNVSAARGGNPLKNPFVKGEDGIFRLPDGVKPSGEFWDHVQRNLRGMADKAATHGEGDKFGAQTISDIRKGINDIIDRETTQANGESLFKNARQGAAKFFGAEDASEAGVKFFNDKSFDIKDARKFFSQFSPQERELFAQSYMAEASRSIRNTPDNADIVKRAWNNPTERDKLRMVVGNERADKIQGIMRVENIFNFLHNKVTGNSTTARQLAQIGTAGGSLGAVGGYYKDPNDPAGMAAISGVSAAATILTSMASKKIDQRLATKVGQLIASGDIADMEKVYKMAKGSKALNDWLSDLEVKIAGATAGKTGDKASNGINFDKTPRVIDISR